MRDIAREHYEATQALNAANVALATGANVDDVRPLELAERVQLLVRERDEARRLAEQSARELASESRLMECHAGVRCELEVELEQARKKLDSVQADLVNALEYGAAQHDKLADAQHALANERQVSEGLRALVDELAHDVAVVTQHRKARDSGGQHFGTGGRLGAATPSTLIYLERFIRDVRALAPTSAGKEST